MTVDPSKVPVFILAGGLGTRLSEETHLKPKPMVEVGDLPILLHIMRLYYSHGFNDFVICAGYKNWEIKNFFLSYEFRHNHVEIDHRENLHNPPCPIGESRAQERWRVRVLDTGTNAMTGARVARAFDLVSKQQSFDNFAVTYGDGLTNANLEKELAFHLSHGKVGTVLGVKSPARFGALDIDLKNSVTGFAEKPESTQSLINGGFFFFKKEYRKYLSDKENSIMERAPLESIAKDGQLKVFEHLDFWCPMDTLRDKQHLTELWDSGKAPWVFKK